MLTQGKSVWRQWRRDQSGGFAILFGLAVLPLIAIMALGVDYFTGLSTKARYDAALDAATLAAVKTAQAYVKANSATQTNPTLTDDAIAAGIAQGEKVFLANAGTAELAMQTIPHISMASDKNVMTATAYYDGTLPMLFGALLGVKTMSVHGASSATLKMTTYINFYVVIDASQSMGIGSTAPDMQRLYTLTQSMGYSDDGMPGCVFGCHSTTNSRPVTDEQVAHGASPPITLRIDAARTAVQDIITQAQASAGADGNIQIGLYTMQKNPDTGALLQTVAAPSSNYAQLMSLSNGVDLGPNSSGGIGDSAMADSLAQFNLLLPANGDGLTPATPLNYVVIVTDGVMDVPGPCAYGHCTQAMPASACAPLKDKASVGVIYTTYLPIYHDNVTALGLDPTYSNLVEPFASQLVPNLQMCTSNISLYFEATDGPALIAAMQSLFASTAAAARLTQ